MLFEEEFAKNVTDKLEVVKANKKICVDHLFKPGKKHPSSFLDTNPEISRMAAEWFQKRP